MRAFIYLEAGMIDLRNPIENQGRRFGQVNCYFPSVVMTVDGKKTMALFTESQVSEALQRAAMNQEDLPRMQRTRRPWYRVIWELLHGVD